MGECSRCGICCTYFPVGMAAGMSPMLLNYFNIRAHLEDRGVFLLKAPCEYLMMEGKIARCGCEDNKPEVCRRYNGKSTIKGMRVWIPKECTMPGK